MLYVLCSALLLWKPVHCLILAFPETMSDSKTKADTEHDPGGSSAELKENQTDETPGYSLI